LLDATGQMLATYGELEQRSAQFANALTHLGLKPGDRVAVQTAKSIEALYLYCGCLRAGLIYLPLNTAYGAQELSHFLKDATPSLLVVDPACADDHASQPILVLTMDRFGAGGLTDLAQDCPSSHSVEPRAPDDIAVIVYTSGTTGLPKGAMISHRNSSAMRKPYIRLGLDAGGRNAPHLADLSCARVVCRTPFAPAERVRHYLSAGIRCRSRSEGNTLCNGFYGGTDLLHPAAEPRHRPKRL